VIESLADLVTTQSVTAAAAVVAAEEGIRGRLKTERNGRYLTGDEEANRPGLLERMDQAEEQIEETRDRLQEVEHGC